MGVLAYDSARGCLSLLPLSRGRAIAPPLASAASLVPAPALAVAPAFAPALALALTPALAFALLLTNYYLLL